MILPPPPQYSSPWSYEHGGSSPFQHMVSGTIIAARTIDRDYWPGSPGRVQTLPSTASSSTPAYHYRRRTTERTASSLSATTAQGNIREYHCEAMPTQRINEDVEGSWIPSWWPLYDDIPPPHTRSMYWTIPLPEIDELDSFEAFTAHTSPMYGSSSPSPSTQITSPPNPNPTQFPVAPLQGSISQWQHVRLHPTLESSYSLSHSPTSIHDTAPATTPSTDRITAMIASTGELIQILPSSPTSPHIVTVGDVLKALEQALGGHNSACDRCRASPYQGQKCRMSILLNSLRLWWCSSDGARPYPWQLVVEHRRQS